jgi:hypothetical protein
VWPLRRLTWTNAEIVSPHLIAPVITVWGHKRLPPATPLVRLSERHLRVINLAAARGFETPNRQIRRLPPPVPLVLLSLLIPLFLVNAHVLY